MTLEYIGIFIIHLVTVVTIVRLIFQWKQLPVSLMFLTALLAAFLIFQVSSFILGSNFLVYKIALLVYYLISWKILSLILHTQSHSKMEDVLLAAGLLGICSLYFLDFNREELLADAVLIQNVIFAMVCLRYYFKMLKRVSSKLIQHQWRFFVITGFFTYSLGSTAMWLVHKIGLSMGAYVDVRYLNTVIYAIEIGLFFWAVQVFISEQKRMKVETT